MLVDITRAESVVIGGLFEQDPFCLPREQSLTELRERRARLIASRAKAA